MSCRNFSDFSPSSLYKIVILQEKFKNVTYMYTKIKKLMKVKIFTKCNLPKINNKGMGAMSLCMKISNSSY